MFTKLNQELKKALKNRDEDTKSFIRSIKSKITEYGVANSLDRTKDPTDEVVTIVISTYKKSLEKAIVQFKKGDLNNPLIAAYEKEIDFLNTYLPNESKVQENIKNIVESTIKELKITDLKQMGKIIGYIMKNNKGLDGSVVKKYVTEKLKGG